MRGGVWVIDSEGGTKFASREMAEILGTTQEELQGKSSFDFVYPEDRGEALRLFRAKANGHIDPFEFRLRRADGSSIWARIQATPMRGPDGEFTGIVGTFFVIDKP